MNELKNILIKYGLEWFGVYYSIYRGEVVSNEDPKKLGRLKIKCLSVYGDNIPEYWAWSKGMPSGKNFGVFAIPSEGDQVWVSFENGDPRFPLWEYGSFRELDTIDEASRNKPNNFVIKSKSGHTIELDDLNKLVKIKSSNGNCLILNENSSSIVSDKISLGTLDISDEPAVLGDTLDDLLVQFLDDIGSLTTIVTSTGVTSSISSAANWSIIKSKWSQKWKDFKSNSVTLNK